MATFNDLRTTGPSYLTSRTVTAGNLDVNGVLTIDQALGEAPPILDLDPGLQLSGIDLLDNGVSILGTAFGDQARIWVRCLTGTATLRNEEVVVPTPANLRLSVTGGSDFALTERPVSCTYDASTQRWRVDVDYFFGSNLVYNDRVGPQSTTVDPNIGTPPTYLSLGSMGSPLVLSEGGQYVLSLSLSVEVSANNTAFWTDVKVNGFPNPIGPSVEPLGLAGARSFRSALITISEPVFGPAVWFDLDFARASGTGSVTLDSAYFFFWRVA